MADRTAEQEAALVDLFDKHGEGDAVDADEGVVLRAGGLEFLIREDGAVSELESSAGTDNGGTEPESAISPAADEQAGDSQDASPPAPPAPTLDIASVSVAPQMVAALTEADERQIQAEIEGRALGAMVYSFKQGGSTITGLSYKGVQEAARQMNTRKMGRIKIADTPAPVFAEITVDVDTGKTDDDGQPIREAKRAVRCTVYGVDEIYGSARFGTATQLREFKRKKSDKKGNPIWETDTFADAKALSKASRNALEGMLPLLLVEELKANYLGKGSVEFINGTAVDVTDLPPALTDDRATQLGDEIRELYEEFKRTHPDGKRALTPGEFGRYFMSAQHDHDRLEDFKSFMAERVDEAKAAVAA
jgi:hypothetical protein